MWRRSRIVVTGVVAVLTGLNTSNSSYAEIFLPSLGASAVQFANESNLNTRLDASVDWKSETPLHDKSTIPKRELYLESFYESGGFGDKSIDLYRAVIRLAESDNAHFWFGRSHPLLEGRTNTTLSPTEAIGANWVQNQSNALTPQVSGWIGAGYRNDNPVSGINFTAAFSPLYLPSFGPRVVLDEVVAPTASRFGTLPPQYYYVGQTAVPMRYRVDIGDIKNIVLQPQLFLSSGYKNSINDVTFMAWSAPSVQPQVDTSGKLRPFTDTNNVTVLVTAVPRFPREVFLGARWAVQGAVIKPLVEGVFETTTQRFTVSAKIQAFEFLELGTLNTWDRPPPPTDGPTVESPNYAKQLIWGQINFARPGSNFIPSLRMESHLTTGQEGYWIHPLVQWKADSRMRLYASANFIGGQDRGYFGNWQSLDNIGVGATYQW